jgi:cell division protein FtsW (lipid II flippase)
VLAKTAETINPVKDKGVLAAFGVILLCILFTAFFKSLGYVVCGAAISFIIMYVIGKRNWVQMILVSVLVPLGMWFIFYKVLTVNIPMGPLTFLRDLVDKF